MGGTELVRKIVYSLLKKKKKKVNAKHFHQKQNTEIPAPTPVTFYRIWSKPNRE